MCNTCHVMIPPQYFNKLPQPFDDEKEELEGTFNFLNIISNIYNALHTRHCQAVFLKHTRHTHTTSILTD
jgi:hypothetical protein